MDVKRNGLRQLELTDLQLFEQAPTGRCDYGDPIGSVRSSECHDGSYCCFTVEIEGRIAARLQDRRLAGEGVGTFDDRRRSTQAFDLKASNDPAGSQHAEAMTVAG